MELEKMNFELRRLGRKRDRLQIGEDQGTHVLVDFLEGGSMIDLKMTYKAAHRRFNLKELSKLDTPVLSVKFKRIKRLIHSAFPTSNPTSVIQPFITSISSLQSPISISIKSPFHITTKSVVNKFAIS
jgi:hypothetical protein